MDTTMSSLAVDEAYVSCIVVDGAHILPPIMTEVRRTEMRRYRDLAVEREQTRRLSRMNITKTLKSAIGFGDSTRPSTGSSSDFSPPTHLCLTSTPRLMTEETEPAVNIMKDEEEIDGLKSMSTSTSSYGQAEEEEATSLCEMADSEASESGGNFASTGSSTGTFIIRTNLSRGAHRKTPSEKSEGEVDEIEDDEEVEEPKTVVRKSLTEEPMFKRKRPARYFDVNDDDDYSSKSEEQSTLRTTTASSTSLSKYLTLVQTPVSPSASTTTSTLLPNSIEEYDSVPVGEQSPSFTINTDFAATALALSKEKLSQRSKGSRRKSKYFSSPGISPRRAGSSSGRTTDPNFDFILTTEIPHSAEKLTLSKTAESDEASNSDSSDKENQIEKKKHVRKLSYTLETPSAALLAATTSSTVDGGNAFSQTLAPIQSAANSVGIPSTLNTPIKGQADNCMNIPPTPTCGDLDVQIDKVQVTLAKFQQLSLGKGKKAHLERYLDEQNTAEAVERETTKVNNNKSNQKMNVAEIALSKIQLEREKQIQALKAQFDLQIERMLEEFEDEQVRLIAEVALKEAKQEQQQERQREVIDSTTTASHSSVLADTSNLRNYYITNETPSKDETNSEVMSAIRSGNSALSSTYFQGHTIPGTPTSQPEQLGNVGLSKLQKKMQKMNPALFKNPVDSRSPLLKGLVFPDPLDRPTVPLKIPPEAYDPAMKPKYERLTAMVKGYLTRRLLHSEKIQIIIQTIKDTVELMLNLYEESSATENGLQVKPQDEELHRRLLQQLTGTCGSFHDVFFKLSTKERMAIIANDREKIRAKALKNVLSRQSNNFGSPSKKNCMSTATLKSIERRLTQDRSPDKKDNQGKKIRRVVKSSSYGFPLGTRSVKPKPVKSYNLSPKRRRMSYWEDKPVNTARVSSAVSGASDNNRNKLTAIECGRSINSASTYSARETSHSSGWSSDTFLIPSSRQGQTSWPNQGKNSSSNKTNVSRPSTGTSRFSVGNPNQPTSGRSARSSTNRMPWK